MGKAAALLVLASLACCAAPQGPPARQVYPAPTPEQSAALDAQARRYQQAAADCRFRAFAAAVAEQNPFYQAAVQIQAYQLCMQAAQHSGE